MKNGADMLIGVVLILMVLALGFVMGATFGQDCVVICRPAQAER